MIKTVKVDLDPKLLRVYHSALDGRFSKMDSSAKDFDSQVFATIREVVDPRFIVAVGKEISFNVQFLRQTLWIFTVGPLQVLIYRPRNFAFPQAQRPLRFTAEEAEKLLAEGAPQALVSVETKDNSLFSDSELADLHRFLHLFFNSKKGDETELVRVLKPSLLFTHESLYLHVFVGKGQLLSHVPRAKDETKKRCLLQFVRREGARSFQLLVVEKQGERQAIVERVVGKWREAFIFLLLCGLLFLLTVCKDIQNPQGLCIYRTELIWAFGGLAIATVGAKFLARKSAPEKKKKLL